MILRSLLCVFGLGLPVAVSARTEDPTLEMRAEQRYRDADRWSARDRTREAATAYFEAGQLFLDAAGAPKVVLPLVRLHRRALSALRRAAVHVPEARSQLAALCAQLTSDTAGRVALPSACNLPPAPPVAPAPEFFTPPVAALPVSAPSPPTPETFPVALQVLPSRAARRGIDVQWGADPRLEHLVGGAGRWQLPRGAHTVAINAPGFERTTALLRVGPADEIHVVRLRRSVASRVRIGLGATYATLGAVLLGTGAALTVDGRRVLERSEAMLTPEVDPQEAVDYFTHAAQVRGQQVALLGAGGGAMLAVPAVATGNPKVSAVSAIVGAMTLGLGIGLHVRARQSGDQALSGDPHDVAFFAEQRRGQVAAAATLGAGAALLTGSVTALVVQLALRRRPALDVRPQFTANSGAVQLSGAF